MTNTAYTPIVSPVYCDYYAIIGCDSGAQLRQSSDGTDEHSYIMIGSFALLAPFMRASSGQSSRFQPGDIITYLKLVSVASDSAIVDFII